MWTICGLTLGYILNLCRGPVAIFSLLRPGNLGAHAALPIYRLHDAQAQTCKAQPVVDVCLNPIFFMASLCTSFPRTVFLLSVQRKPNTTFFNFKIISMTEFHFFSFLQKEKKQNRIRKQN